MLITIFRREIALDTLHILLMVNLVLQSQQPHLMADDQVAPSHADREAGGCSDHSQHWEEFDLCIHGDHFMKKDECTKRCS